MNLKNTLLYFSLFILGNLSHMTSVSAVEDPDIRPGKSHKHTKIHRKPVLTKDLFFEEPLTPKLHKRRLHEPLPQNWEQNTPAKANESPPNKSLLQCPIELNASDLLNIIEKGSTIVNGLQAFVVKEENARSIEFSKKPNITAVYFPEKYNQSKHKNHLVGGNIPSSIIGLYSFYLGEDLITGASIELCFTWPKRG